jgi:hypothetical protein
MSWTVGNILRKSARAICVVSGLHLLACEAAAADDVPTGMVVVNDNGAWSWFEDERAIVDATNGKLLVSSVANANGTGGSARNGDVDLSTLDLTTMTASTFVLHTALQADDHNSAALITRPDGKYLAMYGMHVAGGEAGQQSYYRIATNPGDSSSWGATQSFDNNASMTYSNLNYLPNDNGGAGRMYNFVRSNGFDPNILISSNQGTTWSYGGRLFTEGGGSDRPYVRYFNSGGRIHLITTERHPRDFDNSIYYGYVQDGQLFNANSSVVDSNLFDATAVAPAALTPVFQTGTVVDGAAMRRAWTVDVATEAGGNPVVVFQARANGSDTDHRFFYGRWNGSQWQVNQMGYAGSYLYAAENDYTGLISIDPDDPSTVYLSSEVHPATKSQLIGADGLRHYEIFKGQTSDDGATWNWTPITFNSTMHNIRPVVPKWNAENTALLWLRGDYSTYTNYNMDVVALVNPELPPPELALAVDFGATDQEVQVGFQAFTRTTNPAGDEQSESFDSPLATAGQQVTVTLGGGDVQFADRGNDVAGPLGAIADDFAFLDGDLTLTFGNLAAGNYQLVLYAHDRDLNQLTYDILVNGGDLGTLNPVTGANPTIGIASSRVAFGHDGEGDLTLTLDGQGAGASVVLNGFELYAVGEYATPLPPVDLNADGELDLLDFQLYLAGLHADLSGLTAEQAYRMGDLNGDFLNDYVDYRLFRQSYDEWNGQGSFAQALATVPEPSGVGLLVIGLACGRWMWHAALCVERPSANASSVE